MDAPAEVAERRERLEPERVDGEVLEQQQHQGTRLGLEPDCHHARHACSDH
jgi:hypothetical protein